VTDDGWFTFGIVRRGSATVFLDLCIHTGDARLLFPPDDWSTERAWRGVLIPADAFLALADADDDELLSATELNRLDQATRTASRHIAERRETRTPRLMAAIEDSVAICQESERLLEAARSVLEAANRPRRPATQPPPSSAQERRNRPKLYRVW
jgi:hypothetical protein